MVRQMALAVRKAVTKHGMQHAEEPSSRLHVSELSNWRPHVCVKHDQSVKAGTSYGLVDELDEDSLDGRCRPYAPIVFSIAGIIPRDAVK